MLLSMSPTASLRALSHRARRLAFKFAISAIVLIVLLCCGLRAYTVYIGHRAITLLDEAAQIPVGATEDSILPLVHRYSGFKRAAPKPTPTADCPDKADCEYQNAHIPDYTYEIQLSPFNVFSALYKQISGPQRAIALLMFRTPSFWREPLSLRAWMVYVTIPIRAGRVEGVHGAVYAEGRVRWLANTWSLSADMPNLEWQSKTYVIDGFFLTMTNTGGNGTSHYLTPAATPEQFQAARSINTSCITGLISCRCNSDLAPLAFRYLSQHPDVGSPVTTDDCPGTLRR
jgi:hypothetical protein